MDAIRLENSRLKSELKRAGEVHTFVISKVLIQAPAANLSGRPMHYIKVSTKTVDYR